MMRQAIWLSSVAFVGLALAGCGTGGPAYGPVSSDVPAVIHMTNGFDFEPRTIRIKAGETVEWRNTSLIAHTVTDDPRQDPKAMALPSGAEPFDSGDIPAGQVYRHTFMAPGAYRYQCEPHDYLNMTGTVIVEPSR